MDENHIYLGREKDAVCASGKKTTKRIIGSYGSHKETTSTLSVNSPEEKKKEECSISISIIVPCQLPRLLKKHS